MAQSLPRRACCRVGGARRYAWLALGPIAGGGLLRESYAFRCAAPVPARAAAALRRVSEPDARSSVWKKENHRAPGSRAMVSGCCGKAGLLLLRSLLRRLLGCLLGGLLRGFLGGFLGSGLHRASLLRALGCCFHGLLLVGMYVVVVVPLRYCVAFRRVLPGKNLVPMPQRRDARPRCVRLRWPGRETIRRFDGCGKRAAQSMMRSRCRRRLRRARPRCPTDSSLACRPRCCHVGEKLNPSGLTVNTFFASSCDGSRCATRVRCDRRVRTGDRSMRAMHWFASIRSHAHVRRRTLRTEFTRATSAISAARNETGRRCGRSVVRCENARQCASLSMNST